MRSIDHLLQAIKVHAKASLPWVIYRKPDNKEVKALLQEDDNLYTTKDYSSGFIMALFDSMPPSPILPWEKSLQLNVTAPSEIWFEEKERRSFPIPVAEKENHIKLISMGLNKIKSSALEKVVLSRREERPFGDSPLKALGRLLLAYPDAFVYLWHHPRTGMWMGATPERLLHLRNDELTTMALAGTQPFLGSEDVSWKEKERAEQAMVTETIVEALQEKTFALSIGAPYTSRAGNVLHIRTDITAKLSPNTSLEEIVQALHPTPAVCGSPRSQAKNFILGHEGYDREFYTGYLGEWKLGENTDVYVNLRCMKVHYNSVNLFVGGGITIDSDPEKEWEETVRKAETLGRILNCHC